MRITSWKSSILIKKEIYRPGKDKNYFYVFYKINVNAHVSQQNNVEMLQHWAVVSQINLLQKYNLGSVG
jgi:hypothetical protein